MSDDLAIPIYTIGYGDRVIEEFITLLQRYGVQYLIDVRSAPYSRFRPEFSRQPLEAAMHDAGVRYLFFGQTLGGRPSDEQCYTDGKVDYEKVKSKEFYQEGVLRLERAYRQRQRVALMCSEGRPEQCHRCKLIGVSLDALSIPVAHIDERGNLKTQREVMDVLTGGQLQLFGGPALKSRKRYEPDGADGE
jgi:uncharacterized protein (DUF488 family)